MGLAEAQKDKLVQQIAVLREDYNKVAAIPEPETAGSFAQDWRRQVVRELKSLAMPNVRFEVQWSDVTPGALAGNRPGGFSDFRKSGRGAPPARKGRLGRGTVARHARASHGSGRRRSRQKHWSSMKWMPGSGARLRKPSDRSCRNFRAAIRFCASRTCRRSRPAPIIIIASRSVSSTDEP